MRLFVTLRKKLSYGVLRSVQLRGYFAGGEDDLVIDSTHLFQPLHKDALEVAGAVFPHPFVLHIVGEKQTGIHHIVLLDGTQEEGEASLISVNIFLIPFKNIPRVNLLLHIIQH